MLDDNVPKPWLGRTTLVLALTAASLGVGNLFRFPYLLGEYGGAPFFVVYLIALAAIVLPIMAAEVMLGSNGRGSPVGAMRWVADQSGTSSFWSWIGGAQALVGLVLAAEAVIFVEWMLDMLVLFRTEKLMASSARDISLAFQSIVSDRPHQLLLMAGISILGAVLAALGIRVFMVLIGWLAFPAILVAFIGLLDFALDHGDLVLTQEFLFNHRWDRLDIGLVMAAIECAVTTLAVGVGVGLCLGGRTPKDVSLLRSVAAAAVFDVTVSVMVAISVMALLFAVNVSPADGIGLIFVALPYAFANLPMGDVWGAIFFGTSALASFATILALLEPTTLILRENLNLRRSVASLITCSVVLLLAVAFSSEGTIWLPLVDRVLATLIPLSAFVLVLFVGWRMPRPIARGELYREPRWLFLIWWEVMRLIVPVVLVLLMLWQWR